MSLCMYHANLHCKRVLYNIQIMNLFIYMFFMRQVLYSCVIVHYTVYSRTLFVEFVGQHSFQF